MKEVRYKYLTETMKKALDRAEAAMENAYNPYSKVHVGACLVSETGEFVTGTNFENAAYGSTICAERAAILRANTKGIRRLRHLAVIGRGENFDTNTVTGPCGACRQVLYEASEIYGTDLTVILATTKKDKIVVTTISELLPMPFGPNNLNVNLHKYQ